MALPLLADVTALSDWLGEPITEMGDVKRAEGVLRLASALVRRETGKAWATDDEPPVLVSPLPEALALVTLQCAARGYTNPDGVQRERIDDHDVSYRGDEAGLYLTASERDLLAPYSGAMNQGLSTVATSRGERGHWDLGLRDEERLLPPWY